jgi:NAD(P)H-hydrate epimerase
MPGAAILSGTAALRSGAGIVRLWHPAGMQTELSGFTPELIHAYYASHDHDALLESFHASTANYIGPGIGRHPDTLQLLKSIFTLREKPCVIDADALTLIAENPSLTVPENCVLTPHKGEMDRLLQITDKGIPIDEGYFRLCQNYSDEKKATVVLKGAPTLIFHPNSTPLIGPRGDPGMATAGSGDVLTGVVTAFLAQGLHPQQAAAFGVYLHGIAGEHASRKKTSYSVIASDLIETLPDAFKELQVRHIL